MAGVANLSTRSQQHRRAIAHRHDQQNRTWCMIHFLACCVLCQCCRQQHQEDCEAAHGEVWR